MLGQAGARLATHGCASRLHGSPNSHESRHVRVRRSGRPDLFGVLPRVVLDKLLPGFAPPPLHPLHLRRLQLRGLPKCPLRPPRRSLRCMPFPDAAH